MATRLPEKEDRRVQRTRRALRDALVALIVERGWEKFTVQDVCDRADVGRSTFYMHFADKEELIAGGLRDLGRSLRGQLAALGSMQPLGFSRGLVEHAHEQRRLFLAIVGKKGGHLVQAKFRELVQELVEADLSNLLSAGARRDAAAAFLGGAFLELLRWSLESRSPPAPEEVDRLFQELAQPVLAAARARRDEPGATSKR